MEFWKRVWTLVYNDAVPVITRAFSSISSSSSWPWSLVSSFCKEHSPSTVFCWIRDFLSRGTKRLIEARIQRSAQQFVRDVVERTRLWCVGSCPTWVIDGFSSWNRSGTEISNIVVESFVVQAA